MTEAEPKTKPRERSRAKTASALRFALKSLGGANKKVSISAVAAAVGVTPALIHNKYPDIAAEIRRVTEKGARLQRDDVREKLADAQATIRTLRSETKQLGQELRRLASLNEALRRQLAEAQAVANAKNVVALRPPSADR
jgi:AcrR family transcriptional regulator